MTRLRRIFENTLVGVVVILSLMGMTLMIRASSLWTQEAAGWAQAVGSVAAIGVAIWIAHNDSRERRDEAHTIAIVAAVGTNQQVNSALLHLKAIAKTAAYAIEMGAPEDAFDHLLVHTDDLPAWTVEEIARLAPLPNQCSLHIAHGLALLDEARTLLRASSEVAAELTVPARKARLDLFQKFCNKASKNLYTAHIELSRAKESLGHF